MHNNKNTDDDAATVVTKALRIEDGDDHRRGALTRIALELEILATDLRDAEAASGELRRHALQLRNLADR